METIIGFFAKPLGYLLLLIYNAINNYGITLIIFTAIVKFAMYPLYIKQMKSTMASSKMQGKIKQIRQKYANNREMMNIKLQELYKEEGFNPASGCLPMLIQMPIIFALFALLRNPLTFIDDTNILFAVHESFLWISDMSQADKWILPILSGIATYLSFNISQKNNNQMSELGGAMNSMKYIFPLLIVFMGRNFPAGLALYWFFGQFLQIFFNLHINKLKEKAEKENNRGKRGKN